METFYLGTHMPNWLERFPFPLFVSRRRLEKRKTLPRADVDWACDSGGFSELSMYGAWQITEREYCKQIKRYVDEIGRLAWAAPMDWMCEPFMLKQTGLTTREHQKRSINNYLSLKQLAPDLPFIPVLQGWTVADYQRHVEMYDKYDVDLATQIVGVGSICRRQATADCTRILHTLYTSGVGQIHAFGIKTAGLRTCASFVRSGDSMSWSMAGRMQGKGNCPQFAMRWYVNVLQNVSPRNF